MYISLVRSSLFLMYWNDEDKPKKELRVGGVCYFRFVEMLLKSWVIVITWMTGAGAHWQWLAMAVHKAKAERHQA